MWAACQGPASKLSYQHWGHLSMSLWRTERWTEKLMTALSDRKLQMRLLLTSMNEETWENPLSFPDSLWPQT